MEYPSSRIYVAREGRRFLNGMWRSVHIRSWRIISLAGQHPIGAQTSAQRNPLLVLYLRSPRRAVAYMRWGFIDYRICLRSITVDENSLLVHSLNTLRQEFQRDPSQFLVRIPSLARCRLVGKLQL